MNRLLRGFLDRTIRVGCLEIVHAKGEVYRFGDGTGARARVRFTSPVAEWNVILYPHLKLGEEFMDGGFVLDEGSLYDFLAVVQSNIIGIAPKLWMKAGLGLRYLTRRLRQMNSPVRARKNVRTHYDLDGRLYSLFLDNDLQYSCAYFEDQNAGLEEAQLAKKR